jgi:hypothetical protein
VIQSGIVLFSFLTIITTGRPGFLSLEQLQCKRSGSFAGVRSVCSAKDRMENQTFQ